jgi:dTDP-4-amino-4,6-dideoxygalactose transaminase
MQSRRIVKLAKESKGYSTLLSLPWRGAVVAHVPLISTECNIDAAALENDSLTLRKYYRPLDECAKNANEIFRRIVCVPCHPRVSELSDRQLLNVMHEVRGDKANSR